MHDRYIARKMSVDNDLDAIIPLVMSIAFAFGSTRGIVAAKGVL